MFTDRERLEAQKIRVIKDCLNETPIDIEGLKRCSVEEFGFVNKVLRKRIWPLLLNIDTNNIINHSEKIINHKDTDQVTKDVERSMWRFTKGNSQLRNRKKPELTRIVNAVLSIHPQLYYFQGYHEIASVLLLISDESLAFAMLERLSIYHFNDCMLPNFAEVLKVLNLIFPLISMVDQHVYNFIIKSQVQPMFAISWILTWFSHNLDELDTAARVYDYLLSAHPMASIYLSVCVITSQRETLLNLECSFDSIHAFFTSNLPELDFDKIIKQTDSLLEKITPSKLQSSSKVYLLPESQLNRYPYDWMIFNNNNTTTNSKSSKLITNNKGTNQKRQQIYKFIFFILFGSISLFGTFVFLSIKSPNTFKHINSFLSPLLFNLFNNRFNQNNITNGETVSNFNQ
ncbi:RabGAP/TBC domain-containing protein [Dictyostelium discoideum AX4]|uniref:RabGAP/TBC domain-containing protein n=1 Tax=Dictyostelium discoideum TaxID=44689 RepID=Q54RT5_DICDI|nr:RabGAP/TBC domain-containing protein [Dictyostelium discoideum AX4]EAL65971.1 RabGAP/TBC domain-containing protein [Dictyostelium discoideum AX4]|eukprot:XP_639266.1 RabGAP/TBC domain-containing protein [Dictyostelium discoideum AX4]